MTGAEVAPRAELTVAGRPLTVYAARRTGAERFSRADLDLIARGRADNTVRTIKNAWRRIIKWTAENGYDELPWHEATCVQWIRANWHMRGRYGRPTSPATVQLSLWVITRAHRLAMRPDGVRGYETPVRSQLVQDAMRGYTRDYLAAGHRPDKATPLTPEELTQLAATWDTRSPIGLRDALALCLGYDMGARASELLAVNFEDVEIHVGDRAQAIGVGLDPEADHLVVHVPMSKTDQGGDGDEVFIYAHPAPSADTCPVRLFLAWRQLLRDRDQPLTGRVLRVVAHGGRAPADGRPKRGTLTTTPMAYEGLERIYLRAVEAAGLGDMEGRRRHFALHGLRAGAAEAAAEAGADTPELNRHFRWSQRGTTAQQYANRGLKRRHNPARRIWRQVGSGGAA